MHHPAGPVAAKVGLGATGVEIGGDLALGFSTLDELAIDIADDLDFLGGAGGELAQIRSSGIAFDREEHELHIICIAAPILASSGRVIGGLSITSSTLRHHMADLEKYKPDLIKAAEQIGKVADSWRFPDQKS